MDLMKSYTKVKSMKTRTNRSLLSYLAFSFLLILIITFFIILFFQSTERASFKFNQNSSYWPTNGWKLSTPEKQGMDSAVLIKLFDEIKEKSPYGKVIYRVKHEPNMKTESGKVAKPDIFFTLFGAESAQEIRKAEIQVKAYYPSNKVKMDDIEGSLALLTEKKTDFLHFITLSPLDEELIKLLFFKFFK